MASAYSVWASVTPGLEKVLADELAELGVRGRQMEGGIEASMDGATLGKILLSSRVAAGVRVRVGRFHATNLDQLAAGVRALPWPRFVFPRQPVKVSATLHRCKMRVRENIEGKVGHAITDALRVPRLPGPRPPRTPLLVSIRGEDDQFTVSVDAAGEPMYHRGWRLEGGRAPLRETLAAAVLRLAGFRAGEALMDGMCGSGTFVIEAATASAGIAPGSRRDFAATTWPDAISLPRLSGKGVPGPVLCGSDRDPAAIDLAIRNAARAGVTRGTNFQVADVASLQPCAPTGLLVANPPYGERLGSDVVGVYQALGRLAAGPFRAWRVAVVVPGPEARLLRALSPDAEVHATFKNGGLRVALAVVPTSG